MTKRFLQISVFLLFVGSVFAQSGTLDTSFNPGSGPGGVSDNIINAVQLLGDGKILAAGHFTEFNGNKSVQAIVRLESNGTIDPTFVNLTGWKNNSYIYDMVVQPDGKILLGGQFTNTNGGQSLIRLNADGSLDNSFKDGFPAYKFVYSIAVQPDGKILAGGDFEGYAGKSANNIVRLNNDGSFDETFNPGGAGVGGSTGYERVNSVVVQQDGKILIGGTFTKYNGVTKSNFVRLNSDGSLDTSFLIGTGVAGAVNDISLYPDGRIFIAGDFTQVNGLQRNRVARLQSNGAVDDNFNPGKFTPYVSISGANLGVNDAILQADGKIIICGSFSKYNNISRNGIVRIQSDGNIDNTFLIGTGFKHSNGGANAMALQPDDKVIVGGFFEAYNNVPRIGVARLIGDVAMSTVKNLEQKLSFNVFPNPATSEITISNLPVGSRLSIIDSEGTIIYNSTADRSQLTINTSDYTSGIYFIQLLNKGRSSTNSFIVK